MNKPRKPWLAVLLTILTPGLGHLYCGKARKGIYLFIGSQIISLFSFFLLHNPPYGMLLAVILGVSYILFCLIDSFKLAKEFRYGYEMKKYNRWYFYLMIWILGSIIIQANVQAAVKSNIVEAYKIPSGAMLNTLQIGDHIICNKLFKPSEITRGDVVVFPFPKDPNVTYIKRVVGLGGEKLEIKDKQVYINGNLLTEEYVINTADITFSSAASPRDNFGPVEIPEDHVFVIGDNRDNSYDSRFWGYVNKTDIKGKAIYKYWSWDSDVSGVRWERVGQKIE